MFSQFFTQKVALLATNEITAFFIFTFFLCPCPNWVIPVLAFRDSAFLSPKYFNLAKWDFDSYVSAVDGVHFQLGMATVDWLQEIVVYSMPFASYINVPCKLRAICFVKYMILQV